MDPTMSPTFEINFRVYQEILDACRPFYALDCDGKHQDCYQISVEQNIPPRLEDGLQKTQSKSMPNTSENQHAFKEERPITPRLTLDFYSQ